MWATMKRLRIALIVVSENSEYLQLIIRCRGGGGGLAAVASLTKYQIFTVSCSACHKRIRFTRMIILSSKNVQDSINQSGITWTWQLLMIKICKIIFWWIFLSSINELCLKMFWQLTTVLAASVIYSNSILGKKCLISQSFETLSRHMFSISYHCRVMTQLWTGNKQFWRQ